MYNRCRWQPPIACSIQSCNRPVKSRGWCRRHYLRWRLHGDPTEIKSKTEPGLIASFIQTVLLSETDSCIKWPFSTEGNGYGKHHRDGKHFWAHRLFCELAHGEAPNSKPLAIHSCGNGQHGCVNPHHIRWGSWEDNSADCVRHGRAARGSRHGMSKLTESDVKEIRNPMGASRDCLAARVRRNQTHGLLY